MREMKRLYECSLSEIPVWRHEHLIPLSIDDAKELHRKGEAFQVGARTDAPAHRGDRLPPGWYVVRTIFRTLQGETVCEVAEIDPPVASAYAEQIRRDQQKILEDAKALREMQEQAALPPERHSELTCPACQRFFYVGQDASTYTMGGIQTALHTSCLDRMLAAGIPINGNPRKGIIAASGH